MIEKAPFFDKQPTDKMTEIFCLVGSKAWNALGYSKDTKQANGEEWALLCQATGRKKANLPLILDSQQLKSINRLKITDTQTMIRFCIFGELTETEKNAIALNLAKHSPVEHAIFADNLGYEVENISGYIARLRADEDSRLLAEMTTKEIDDNAPKRTSYIEYRQTEKAEGLFYVVPQLDKATGEILGEKEKWICSNFELKGQGKDDNGDYYYLFSWKNIDEKKARVEAIPLADFGSEAGWKILKSKGVKMTQGQGLTANLTEHFHAQSKAVPNDWRVTNLKGWQSGAYILPNGEMIGEADKPLYFSEKSGASEGYTTSGTLESWQKEIADNLRGNHSMMLGVAVALSAPLLSILGRDSFGVHLYAESSKGKTTTLNIANSIYGNPEKLKLSWSTTAMGVKNEATARNDSFLTLDEIGQAKNVKDLESIAYDIFNETGKLQGKKEGGNRAVNRWKITALSTGEKDLETQLANQGAKVHAGQLVRLLNIPIMEVKEIHGFNSVKAHADHLNEQVLEHFGIVGREWIAFLSQNKELAKETYKQTKKKWLERSENMSGQVQRVATDRFATLETALILAKHLTKWSDEESDQAVLNNFLNWKELYGENSHEEKRILSTLTDWILANELSFYEHPYNEKQVLKGNPVGFKVLSVLGGDKTAETEHYYIYPKPFKDALHEFSKKTYLEILANAGILDKPTRQEAGYDYQFSIPKNITGGKKIRAYKIILEMLDDE
ncbi:hypothetical protein BMT54_08390 [Pasteurellaceae bacterium 15-036681]|nr:hypothetical protein BMT54_08390 [Pasteurellaceae bacterium 15-036681]